MTTTHDTPVDPPVTTFSTDIAGLDECIAPTLVDLAAGDAFELRIAPVVKQIGENRVRMLAYNGSIPGPTLRVRQGSEISVRVRNDADTEATVHWHGLCLDNNYDGVPYETQDPIAIGGDFTYQVRFPDAGLYWYHPHIREDYGLDMGLYGNLVVEPADPDYWPPVNREFVVTLDDVLLEDGHITPYNLDGPNFVAMGRFGNVMLTGGQSTLELAARAGEVVRFYLTNTANTRLFNVTIPGARMKLVGGDSGRYERHTFVDDVLLSPSERAIIDVLFETPGEFTIAHNTPTRSYVLGAITVTDEPIDESFLARFQELRTCPDLTAERVRIDAHRDRPPDKTLAFESSMPLLYGDPNATADTWTCPMHPDVISAEQGTCPQCGMKLVAAAPSTWTCPMHPELISAEQGTCPQCGMKLVAAAPSAWTCPMHPDVISAEQGTCPQCGMKLVAAALSAWTCPMHPQVISARAGHVPAVRDEARRRTTSCHPGRRPRRAARSRHARWPRVGGLDARHQPCIGLGQHDLEARRSRHRTGQRRDRLGVHRWRSGENPPRQRSPPGPSDASPVPHPRCRPIPCALSR